MVIRSEGREREKKVKGKWGGGKRGNWDEESGTRGREIQTVDSVCVCIYMYTLTCTVAC